MATSTISLSTSPTAASSMRSTTYTTQDSGTLSNTDISTSDPMIASSSILTSTFTSQTPMPPSSTGVLFSSGIPTPVKSSTLYATSSTSVSSDTTPEGNETDMPVAILVAGVLGAVVMILFLLVIVFVIIIGINRQHSKQSASTFNNTRYNRGEFNITFYQYFINMQFDRDFGAEIS